MNNQEKTADIKTIQFVIDLNKYTIARLRNQVVEDTNNIIKLKEEINKLESDIKEIIKGNIEQANEEHRRKYD